MMPGDVGLIAALLTKMLGYAVDPDGYEQWSRDRKLTRLMEGIDAAVLIHDDTAVDVLFNEYRGVLQQAGP
jgi:hypothetical protein